MTQTKAKDLPVRDLQDNGSPHSGLPNRVLTIEIARVTEAAAVAAARLRGRGDERAADMAAIDAMHSELAKLAICGEVVIGEGERGESSKLHIGEKIGAGAQGAGGGPDVDIAADPLEGTTLCAKSLPNAVSALAIAEKGGLLNVPNIYMDKIAIGPGYAPGIVDLDNAVEDNIAALAGAKGVPVNQIMVCVLDRPRHGQIIASVRKMGAGVTLIPDGDLAGVIWTTDPEKTCIDMFLGSGGASEGVMAAAALRCIGGQMQCRLKPASDDEARLAVAMGVADIDRKYALDEMASGDAIFAATGVTGGPLLRGVQICKGFAETETLVLRAATGTVRRINTRFRV